MHAKCEMKAERLHTTRSGNSRKSLPEATVDSGLGGKTNLQYIVSET